METLLIVVGATLAISAFCSLLEATLYSTRVATLEAAKAEGRHSKSAARLLELKRDIAGPTSAILILNTIANTAGATLAGWLAARALGAGYVPHFSALFTLGILLLSEIVPKTYGATKWRSLWPWLASPLTGLVRVLGPAVWLAERFAALLTAGARLPAVTEDEIRASIQMGGRSGELTRDELQMLNAIFRFDDTAVREVMVPRQEVAFCNLGAPVGEFADQLRGSPFTRFPACEGDLDHVVGMLHMRDLAGVPLNAETDLRALVRDVLQVPETLPISQLLRQMQSARRQLAVAIDEHGAVAGIVTLTEILEQIVGSLEDELETPEPEPIARESDTAFNVRGNVALARVNRVLGVDFYDPSTVTLSGMLVSKLGRLPRKGDMVDLGTASAEVVEAQANRATRIRVTLARPPEIDEEAPDDEDSAP